MFNILYMLTRCVTEEGKKKKLNNTPCVSEGEECELSSQGSNEKDD